MFRIRRNLQPLSDRGPLRVMFVLSSMPVGGAETLLVDLVRRLDRTRFTPLLCCLQSLGPLGEELAREISATSGLIHGKYDARVLYRLTRLFARERVDAVVTIGAGDKMFWGRIAAHLAGVPVVCSAIHSTGWPDVIERPNRWRLLSRWTDAFIAVAADHARHLIDEEHFPAAKVRVIANGVDCERFCPADEAAAEATRQALGIDAAAPLVGIVAALRPEKNHELLLHALALVRTQIPKAQLLVVGDGATREKLVELTNRLKLDAAVHFLGNRQDIPALLGAVDVFALTSRMEASPVSILEAMACGKPVVAPRVGSIAESVLDGQTGYLTEPGDEMQVATCLVRLLQDPAMARRMGQAGRAAVLAHGSLSSMVAGYEQLLAEVYSRKVAPRPASHPRSEEPVVRPLVYR